MDAIRKIELTDIRQLVEKLILADRMMQRKGLIWGDQYEEMSKPIRAARKALDDALEANEQTIASKEAELVRLRTALQDIAENTDPDNGENYRADDREGCLDAMFATATAALTQPTE